MVFGWISFLGGGGERGSRGFQGGSEGNQSSLTGFKDGAIEKSTAKRVLSMTSRYRGAKKKKFSFKQQGLSHNLNAIIPILILRFLCPLKLAALEPNNSTTKHSNLSSGWEIEQKL